MPQRMELDSADGAAAFRKQERRRSQSRAWATTAIGDRAPRRPGRAVPQPSAPNLRAAATSQRLLAREADSRSAGVSAPGAHRKA
jgi:hypothetical protein